MSKRILKIAAALAFLSFGSCSSFGQRINPVSNTRGSSQAQGTLTVTLTVVSSVGVVTGPDGQPRIVAANAATASDNVSSVHYVRLNEVNPASSGSSQPGRSSVRKRRRK